MADISAPFLPTIKCTSCHIHIDIRTLDNHICVPIKNNSSLEKLILPLPDLIDSQENESLPPPNIQRRSRERSNALNNSVRRIFQKIKGKEQQYKSTDSSNATALSPTLSIFSFTSSNNTIITPRSSKDYFQQYLLKQAESDLISSQKNNNLIRLKTKDCKKPVIDTAALQQLVTNMSIEDLCQNCSKSITLCDDSFKDPITKYSYHQSCYCCSLCRVLLSACSSFEFNGKLYCVRDYKVVKSRPKLSIKQSQSPLIINNTIVPVKNKMAMPKSCYHCKIAFNDSDTNYKTFKNRIYCNSDFRHLFLLPKCRSCKKAIEKEAIPAMNGKLQGKWHIECFNCQMCHASFPDSTFYVYQNQPYCKTHYHYLNNSICNRCHQGIENACTHTNEGWRFHPKCFICEMCQKKLSDKYYVFESRIYCQNHIKRQFINNNDQTRPPLEARRTRVYNFF